MSASTEARADAEAGEQVVRRPLLVLATRTGQVWLTSAVAGALAAGATLGSRWVTQRAQCPLDIAEIIAGKIDEALAQGMDDHAAKGRVVRSFGRGFPVRILRRLEAERRPESTVQTDGLGRLPSATASLRSRSHADSGHPFAGH
jgi:hypothetical protein